MVWDKGEPHEGIDAPDLNDVIRDNNDALEAALNTWFRFVTGGTQTGQPRQGSARIYCQAATPTTRLNGSYFDSSDLGTPWIDSDDNKIYILTAADGAGTDTWTYIGTEVIATLVAAIHTWAAVQTFSVSPSFTKGIVANDSYIQGRNNADDGNIDIVKVNTSDGLTFGAVSTLPDTSALATSGAPTADAQISNKKYVDDQVDSAARVQARAKAWVNFDGDDGSIRDHFNVTSVTRSSTGTYQIAWDTNFANTNYAVVGIAGDGGAFAHVVLSGDSPLAVGTCDIKVINHLGTLVDVNNVHVIAFGDQ